MMGDKDVAKYLVRKEGFLAKPTDIGDGKITLGSGLTDPKWRKLYRERGNVWSKEDNWNAVMEEVANRRAWAEEHVPNWNLLPEMSQDAMLSYKYNYDFNRNNSPKLFKAMENKDFKEAGRQMDATSKDPKFKKGLQKRRGEEQYWFNAGLATDVKPIHFNRGFFGEIGKGLYNTIKGNAHVFGGGGLADSQKNWRQKHQSQWYGFLKKKGLNDADASRLSGFFTVQDGLESAGGTSAAAREKNNYGGMQRSGKNVSYDSINDYMEDKWRMMSSKFKHALEAKSIDEFATTLGNPDLAGKNYLYYVTDKVKYDPKSNAWRNAQTKHMHNYINGMRTWAGMNTFKFNDEAIGYNGQEKKDKIYGQYGDYHETPAFMPSNPEAFFAPLSTYTRPVVAEEPEQPLVDMAALEAQQQREAERQERRERLGLLLGMISGGNENSSLSGLIGLLGGKGFNGLNGLMGY